MGVVKPSGFWNMLYLQIREWVIIISMRNGPFLKEISGLTGFPYLLENRKLRFHCVSLCTGTGMPMICHS